MKLDFRRVATCAVDATIRKPHSPGCVVGRGRSHHPSHHHRWRVAHAWLSPLSRATITLGAWLTRGFRHHREPPSLCARGWAWLLPPSLPLSPSVRGVAFATLVSHHHPWRVASCVACATISKPTIAHGCVAACVAQRPTIKQPENRPCS